MKSLKKIAVSFLVVLAMSCTMIGTWAANTNQITQYTVQTSENGTEWTDVDTSNIAISSEHMLRVNVTLQSAGEVTLMSYKDGVAEYNNNNIQYQYVAQETYDGTNLVTITFRPRASLGVGVYDLKIGAEGVSTPVSFNYVVQGALSVTANSNSLCVVPEGYECADVATYTIDRITDTAEVKIGDTTLTKGTHYTISENTLEINPAAIPAAISDKKVGSYALTVTDGDKTGYSTLNVCPAVKYEDAKFGVSDSTTPVTKVCATTVPDGAGGHKIPLKPYPSYLSAYGTKVTHTDDLFIGWKDTDNTTHTADSVVYIPYTEARKTLTAQYGSQDAKLTKTGYQKIKYTDDKGNEHDAIRFVALVDLGEFSVGSDNKISNITSAGFVVSDICSSPTKEGGFAFTNESTVYNQIKTRANLNDTANQDVTALETKLGVAAGKYDCILTSILDIDTKTNQKDQKIGAVAYIEYTDAKGVKHLVYGQNDDPKSYAEISSSK